MFTLIRIIGDPEGSKSSLCFCDSEVLFLFYFIYLFIYLQSCQRLHFVKFEKKYIKDYFKNFNSTWFKNHVADFSMNE